MIRKFLVSVLFIFAASIVIEAQQQQTAGAGMAPGLRRRALVLDISAKVIDEGQSVIWEESNRKMAIPGSPVSIKLVGSNVIVVMQFTPFVRRQGNVLVAQGQIWIDTPERGVSYYTSIQTIPMDFNEPLYFFPLGTSNPSIEIMLTVNPYREAASLEEGSADARNGE